jgi:uncharacterized surface anchored protein
MKNKKYILSLIVLGISLVIGMFFGNATNAKGKIKAQEPIEAHLIKDNIFEDVTITVPGEKNRVLEQEDYLQNNSEVKVSMRFKFVNKNYKAGDSFVTNLPAGFVYKGVLEGELNDSVSSSATASYAIDSTTNKLTLTFTKDVPSAEYTIDWTTRINYADDQNSKQTMLFETQSPTKYDIHLYKSDAKSSAVGKLFDKDGKSTSFMPATGQFEGNVNYKHIDLSTLKITYTSEIKPSNWDDGFVKMTHNIDSLKFYTYDTAINGSMIGEKRELIKGQDFTMTQDADGSYQVQFKTPFFEALEVAEGETTFDYSDFNPISNGTTGTIYNAGIFFYAYSKANEQVSSFRFNYTYNVLSVGYLGLGKLEADKQVKENERIVKVPIYINGTNQELKKGDTFTLTTEGSPAIVMIDTDLAREYPLSISQTSGTVTEGTKGKINHWQISTDEFGKIILTYTGDDTTEAFGLDLYAGIDDSIEDSFGKNFELSGNGYKTTGKPVFKGKSFNSKTGVYNAEKSYVSWEATINSLYQKVTKLTDTFSDGMKAGSLKNLTIRSVAFGQNATSRILVEHEDYELIDKSDSFEIKFLKGEMNEKLTITYNTQVDLDTVDLQNFRVKNIITPTIKFNPTTEKELETIGYAYLPAYLKTNAPYLFSRNGQNSTTEKIEQRPVNQIKLLINPAGMELTNNKIVINHKSLDVSILDKKIKVNKVNTLSLANYGSLILGEEIPADSDEYPKFTIEDDQLVVSNKKLSEPMIVSFTYAKNNYYNVTKDIVTINQTTDNLTTVKKNSDTLYFNNWLDSSFVLKASDSYSNIAEGTFKIDKNNGSAIIKGTEINVAYMLEAKEISALREVTDGEGNPLPATTVTLSTSGNQHKIIVNADNLTNGLIVKLKWSFATSGQKTYYGGYAAYIAKNFNGASTTQSYSDSSYKWQGSLEIDNSGAGGKGEMLFSDLILNIVDSGTSTPLSGAVYEIINEDGTVIATETSNNEGQIILKDSLVTTYRIREVTPPNGYSPNEEYQAPGKSYTMSASGGNVITISYAKSSQLTVHFSYEDGTDLETAAPVTIAGSAGSTINLKAQKAVADQLGQLALETADYHFLAFDNAGLEGTETSLKFPSGNADVYFKYEGLLSLQVPKLLTFETGFVSPFTQTLSYENQDDFEVSLRDSRQITSSATTNESKTRGNIRLNASLSKEFKTSKNKVLRDAQLYYQTGGNSVLLNGAGGELVSNRQDAANPSQKDFTFILDTTTDKSEGFKLEVPAKGTLAEEYTGEVTWEIIQEP